jgi:hypothetical protein
VLGELVDRSALAADAQDVGAQDFPLMVLPLTPGDTEPEADWLDVYLVR